ncbi:MAG: hypothetical protein ABL962_19030 [Fimbriimonadaceae bacterium]
MDLSFAGLNANQLTPLEAELPIGWVVVTIGATSKSPRGAVQLDVDPISNFSDLEGAQLSVAKALKAASEIQAIVLANEGSLFG